MKRDAGSGQKRNMAPDVEQAGGLHGRVWWRLGTEGTKKVKGKKNGGARGPSIISPLELEVDVTPFGKGASGVNY